MGAEASHPPLKLSAVTNQDSDGNPMLKAHAFKAQSKGEVYAYARANANLQYFRGYIGSTADPAGAGDLLQEDILGDANQGASMSFTVENGQYFEFTTDSANAITIKWRSYGPLKKPVDYN